MLQLTKRHRVLGLGCIRTSGEVLSFVKPDNATANGGVIAAHGNDIWYTDLNNDSLWRYDVTDGQFTQFEVPTPNADPPHVAVAPDGEVWFTDRFNHRVGYLDPSSNNQVTQFGTLISQFRPTRRDGRRPPTTDSPAHPDTVRRPRAP